MIFGINTNGACKRSVNRIPSEQTGSFIKIFGYIFRRPKYDGFWHQILSSTRLFNQQPHHQPANTTETINHDIPRLVRDLGLTIEYFATGTFDIFRDAHTLVVRHIGTCQFTDIYVRWGKIKSRHHCDHRMGFELRQLVLFDLPNPTMGFHDFDHRLIEQRHTVDINNDIATIKLTNQGNHRFRECFTLFPIRENLI